MAISYFTGMFGFHDRLLTLRKALHTFLSTGDVVGAIYRRWRWQSHLQNMKCGLILTEKEWEEEWDEILRLASTEPVSEPKSITEEAMYESLEEIHVLALAHILCRPIIVVADTIIRVWNMKSFPVID